MACCPDYDRMLTRCAVLVLTLRKVAVAAHQAHDDGRIPLYMHCPQEPCARITKAIATAGLTGTGAR